MNCLIVENGIITNIIIANETFAAAIGALPYDEGAKIGGMYVPPPDYGKLRADALKRIDGKCSGAIASGVTVGGKHYKLTATAQSNLATAQSKIDGGAAKLIYAADGEEPTLHTAAQITAISDAAYKWGVVNTSYYAKLKMWIARETDAAVLGGVEYGKRLPADLMQELAGLLGSVGIDVGEYGGMFG